jgi:hypothetical protein
LTLSTTSLSALGAAAVPSSDTGEFSGTVSSAGVSAAPSLGCAGASSAGGDGTAASDASGGGGGGGIDSEVSGGDDSGAAG